MILSEETDNNAFLVVMLGETPSERHGIAINVDLPLSNSLEFRFRMNLLNKILLELILHLQCNSRLLATHQ